jgi:signal transduction histidine kinase
MRIRRPIRHRLVTVAALGVITAVLAAAALYRVISFSMAQRLERAREAVAEEYGNLVAGAGTSDAVATPPTMIGMRGGIASGVESIAARVPPDWRLAIASATERAVRERRAVNFETPIASSVSNLILGPGVTLAGRVGPAGAEGRQLAWMAVAVKPSQYNQSWRLLVVALTVAALLLVSSAVYALVTIKRGASALQAALRTLATDLSAPVPRPTVHELGEIADGIATLARHLAESRQAQERLGRDLARQERLVALGRVVAGVAHEVRNPLASIKLRLDLAMTTDAGIPSSVLQPIAHASAEITRLDRLVADLLIVSGRTLGPRQQLNIGQLLRTRAEAMAPWCAERDVTVRVTTDPSAAVMNVDVDGDAVARALDNLLRNAVEASPRGATINATADAAAVDTAVDGTVAVANGAPAVRVRIEDRGPGVPVGRAGELFEPFFTTKAEGTGLGLAISRAIARAHGGDVTYGREDGVTRFELTVSRAGEPARQVEGAA